MSAGERGERGETYGCLVHWWIPYARAAAPLITPITPEETNILCLSESLINRLAPGAAEPWRNGSSRSPEDDEILVSENDDDPHSTWAGIMRFAGGEGDSGHPCPGITRFAGGETGSGHSGVPAGDGGPESASFNHAQIGSESCGGIGNGDFGGKLPPVAPLSEPGARFSDAALGTSRCLCRTIAGAVSATFATEKIRRIRANILS
jgi:hypothetical protein